MAKDNAAPPAAHRWTTTSARETIRRRFFPDMTLTTHEGKQVRLYEDLLENKCVLLNFMYAHCEGICSPVTMNLRQVQSILHDRVGRDIDRVLDREAIPASILSPLISSAAAGEDYRPAACSSAPGAAWASHAS